MDALISAQSGADGIDSVISVVDGIDVECTLLVCYPYCIELLLVLGRCRIDKSDF